MEDGEAAAAATGDGAANGSPKLSRTSNPDLVTIEPNDRQLFIKTITPDVSREELEAVSYSSVFLVPLLLELTTRPLEHSTAPASRALTTSRSPSRSRTSAGTEWDG